MGNSKNEFKPGESLGPQVFKPAPREPKIESEATTNEVSLGDLAFTAEEVVNAVNDHVTNDDLMKTPWAEIPEHERKVIRDVVGGLNKLLAEKLGRAPVVYIEDFQGENEIVKSLSFDHDDQPYDGTARLVCIEALEPKATDLEKKDE